MHMLSHTNKMLSFRHYSPNKHTVYVIGYSAKTLMCNAFNWSEKAPYAQEFLYMHANPEIPLH